MAEQRAIRARERAECTARVYTQVIKDGGQPTDAFAALMDWWAVDHPRAGGLLWEAGALGLIPQFYVPKRGR